MMTVHDSSNERVLTAELSVEKMKELADYLRQRPEGR